MKRGRLAQIALDGRAAAASGINSGVDAQCLLALSRARHCDVLIPKCRPSTIALVAHLSSPKIAIVRQQMIGNIFDLLQRNVSRPASHRGSMAECGASRWARTGWFRTPLSSSPTRTARSDGGDIRSRD